MGDRGEVLLAPGAPGEIILLHLDLCTPWAIQKVPDGVEMLQVSIASASRQVGQKRLDVMRCGVVLC